MEKQEFESFEIKANNAIVDLIRKVYKVNSSAALDIIDRVVSSSASCKHDQKFVRLSMSVLAKNNRLEDARDLAGQFFSKTNQQAAIIPEAFKAEYDDICLRCDQGILTSEPTSAYYDSIYSISEEYKKLPADSVYAPVWQFVVSQIVKYSNSHSLKILDIGCGPGQFARFLQSEVSNVNYLGIDTSSTAISQAQEKTNDCKFICTTLDNIDGQILNVIDLFLALEVLEHIEEDLRLIQALPGGKPFIFTVPSFDSFGHMRYFRDSAGVSRRYSCLFNNFSVKAVRLGSTLSVIYACQGITL